MIQSLLEILIGAVLAVLAVHPKSEFYEGRLGTKQVLPPLEPAWIMRLIFVVFALAAILDGLSGIHRP